MAELEKRSRFEGRQIDLGASGLLLLSPSEESNHRTRQPVLAIAATAAMIIIGIATQKWGAGVPNWLLVMLGLIPFFLWFYWGWTHEKLKKVSRPLIYNYPVMSLIAMIIISASVGGGIGALLWQSIRSENKAAVPRTREESAPATLESERKEPTMPLPQPPPAKTGSLPNKPRSNQRSRISPPDDGEAILLGGKKGPKNH